MDPQALALLKLTEIRPQLDPEAEDQYYMENAEAPWPIIAAYWTSAWIINALRSIRPIGPRQFGSAKTGEAGST